MSSTNATRRTHGQGTLRQRGGKWYGQWPDPHRPGKKVQRVIGPVRTPHTRDGLTRPMAEKAMRGLRESADAAPVVSGERVTVEEAGRRLIAHREAQGLKKSTLEGYRSYLTQHLAPYFGTKPLGKITADDVEAFIAAKRKEGQSVKSTLNYIGLLHGICEQGQRKGWCATNPVKHAEKPRKPRSTELRYLSVEELEAVIAAVPDDPWGTVERVLYRCAAMTGMRQSEVLALRWRDVDFTGSTVRVERGWVRGEFNVPKGGRGRDTPLMDDLAGELHRLWTVTPYKSDGELVFGHPETGKPLDRSKLYKRYKTAVKRAGVRHVRFHDLRHTWATVNLSGGVPLDALQQYGGWEDAKTARIYAKFVPKKEHAAMMQQAFRAAASDASAASSDAPADLAAVLAKLSPADRAALLAAAPALGTDLGTELRHTDTNSDQLNPDGTGVAA